MKNIGLAIILSGLFYSVGYTQSFSEISKPTSENPWSIEMNIYSTTTSINWNQPALRARYFFNNKWAARFQVGIGDGSGKPMSRTNYFYENPDGSGDVGTQEIKRTALNFQIGGEYHFKGTKKLDPYAAIGFNFGFGKQTENGDKVTTAPSPPGAPPVYYYGPYSSYTEKTNYKTFGGEIGLGMDFYFLQNIYLGIELRINYFKFQYSDKKKHVHGDNEVDPVFDLKKVIEPKHRKNYLNVQAIIRLGWRF